MNTYTPKVISVYTNIQYRLNAAYLLVCKLVRHHKQVNSGQARSGAKVGYLHPFI